MMEIIFWVSLLLIIYTYLLYGVIIWVWSKFKRKKIDKVECYIPNVSVVISAFNEENIIHDRILNLLEVDYPKDKIEILIGSDNSSDNTDEIIKKFNQDNVHLFSFSIRRGKASVLNDLIPKAKGEIIIFSDANTFYRFNTVQELVQNFSMKNVGAVCGELILKPGLINTSGKEENIYWTYENALKKMESMIKTIAGATGAVYAIRKNLFVSLPINKAVMDDFLIPLEVIKKGYAIKYNPLAIAYENSVDSIQKEFRRKVRIGAANFHGIKNFAELLHPRYGFVAFMLWSHKIIRWCVPFLLLICLCSSAILSFCSDFFLNVLCVEITFLVLSILGFLAEKFNINIGNLRIPYYFLAMNAALFIGFIKFLFKII